jgi:GTPase SAR1 family protein
MSTYNDDRLTVVLLGTGKTDLVESLTSRNFNHPNNNIGITITSIDIPTTSGILKFNVYDPGNIPTNELDLSMFDAAIVMFDVTSQNSFGSVKHYIEGELDRKNVLFVVCGTKVDCRRSVKPVQINAYKRSCPTGDFDYCEISSKTGFNIKKPFLHIANNIFNNNFRLCMSNSPFVNSPEDIPFQPSM